MGTKDTEKHVAELKTEVWRLKRLKGKKADLEESLLAYWHSIPQDFSTPAKVPDLIKITKINDDGVSYNKYVDVGGKYVCFGMGHITRKNIDTFYNNIDDIIERLKGELGEYGVTELE